MNDRGVAILISSCDIYADLWKPYFTFFFRYWPDCPFPIYLVANDLEYEDERVITLRLGSDHGWAGNTRRALEQVQSPYVLYTHEDFFLNRSVSNTRILQLLDYMKLCGAGYLRLYPSPGPDEVCADNPEVGEIKKGSEYRTSLQAAIWKREVMLSLLVDGESPWQMERNGSLRSNALDVLFLSSVRDPVTDKVVDPPLSYFCTAVYKGLWMREAVEFCRKEGVPIDLTRRGTETAKHELWRSLSPYLSFFIKPLLTRRRRYLDRKRLKTNSASKRMWRRVF